ncbi:hypothetical protein DFH06DRAFT_1028514 [Mycena polygramma]|nr:hypothetical protein DFH06DRAFT_1028514 [Mycena polygramma]
MSLLPATHTKHSKVLSIPIQSSVFHLAQSDDGVSNGTALWLGAQCLSAYLTHSAVTRPGMRAIELGSGIGLTALCLARLGCNTIATDLPWVISSCLARNIETNVSQLPPESGDIIVRELDWNVLPDQWFWEHPTVIASPTCPPLVAQQPAQGFDLIVSADTIYSPDLITPFLRTLHALCKLATRTPVVLICLERRDPALVNQTLEEAQNVWGFVVSRISQHKVSKALRKSGFEWEKEDWEGVELWKLTLRR